MFFLLHRFDLQRNQNEDFCDERFERSRSAPDGAGICLAGTQRDQSLVAGVGDADNSLSMSWVKLGSTGCMNHADCAGGGRHVAATG